MFERIQPNLQRHIPYRKTPLAGWASGLSLAAFDQMIAQEVKKPHQPQFAIDDRTAALDGIVDADIEHPREQLDQLFHVGTGTVDTAVRRRQDEAPRSAP